MNVTTKHAEPETSLVDFSKEPTTLTIGEKTYEVHPLRMSDFCKAQRFVKEQNLGTFLQQTRLVPLEPEDRGIALARIATTPVSLGDILRSKEGELQLLYLSLKRGDPSLKWEWLRDNLPPLEVSVLSELMAVINGLSAPEDGNGQAPLTTTTTTTSETGDTTGENT